MMKSEEIKNRIKELTDQVNHHNDLYYQRSKPEISDYEFDQLLAELVKLENEHREFRLHDSHTKRVGGTITKDFATVYYQYAMLSLGNTY